MGTFLIIPVLASASVALVAAISALRAGFRLSRTRIELQTYFSAEVVRLAERATELEKNLAALDARAQALPVRVSELQENLVTLGILTNALTTSLRQAQKILSSTGFKSSLAKPLAEAVGNRARRSSARQGEAPRP